MSYGVGRIKLSLTNLPLDPFFSNLELAHHFEEELAVGSITMQIKVLCDTVAFRVIDSRFCRICSELGSCLVGLSTYPVYCYTHVVMEKVS